MKRHRGRAFGALACGLFAMTVAGCGGGHRPSAAELHTRRADLSQVAQALIGVQAHLTRELAAARLAWPLIDHGLPPVPAPTAATKRSAARVRSGHRAAPPAGAARAERKQAERKQAELARRTAARARHYAAAVMRTDTAAALAQQLPQALVADASELTGPASGIASLYGLAAGLLEHSWNQIRATLTARGPGMRAHIGFLRANVNTYIIAVYDGHFDLSLIGKAVQQAYTRLGAAKEFGDALTPTQVAEIASSYGPRVERLRPYPWEGLVGQIEAYARGA